MTVSRRAVLRGAGAAAVGLAIGFDPVGRRWITAADATTCSFDDVPPLQGDLLFDAAARSAAATDKGNYVTRTPCAVLRPASVEDIAIMIRYCRKRGIAVSTRGQAHSTYGQSLADGLIIDNQSLANIHDMTATHAVVDTGSTWKALVEAAYENKLTPPVLTGYTQLTIGGTLSMGGIGGLVGGMRTGLQVDHVRALQVVTGKGDIVACSPTESSALFDAVLGGLGQFGVITKATVDLVPAKDRARTYLLHYPTSQLDAMFRDFPTLLDRDGIDHTYVLWFPPGTADVAQINATVFYDVRLNDLPSDTALIGGLSTAPVIQDTTYLDYVFLLDTVIDGFEPTLQWSRLAKPWFDVWLTDATVEAYAKEVIQELTAEDVGATGFVLTFATKRSLATRPNVMLPFPDGSSWVFLFDVLTSSNTPDPGEEWRSQMLARNDRLFAHARESYGGVRYPIGTLTFTSDDWQRHYGSRWPTVVADKAHFDPASILGTGVGVFT